MRLLLYKTRTPAASRPLLPKIARRETDISQRRCQNSPHALARRTTASQAVCCNLPVWRWDSGVPGAGSDPRLRQVALCAVPLDEGQIEQEHAVTDASAAPA
jgi:hypothetical protein